MLWFWLFPVGLMQCLLQLQGCWKGPRCPVTPRHGLPERPCGLSAWLLRGAKSVLSSAPSLAQREQSPGLAVTLVDGCWRLRVAGVEMKSALGHLETPTESAPPEHLSRRKRRAQGLGGGWETLLRRGFSLAGVVLPRVKQRL